MTQDELDKKLRERFVASLDDIYRLANDSRDIEALGSLAQLIGTCIDWDKEAEPQFPTGFQGRKKEEEDE